MTKPYFARVLKDGQIRTIYSPDMQIVGFNPSLYGEADPTVYDITASTFGSGAEVILIPKSDEEVLAVAKQTTIDSLHMIRSARLDRVANAKGMTAGVAEAYAKNQEAAHAVSVGRGSEIMATDGVNNLTYIDYLTPKSEALGLPSVEYFVAYIQQEAYTAIVGGSLVEEEYCKKKTQVELVTLKHGLDAAVSELNAIITGWV